MKYFTAKTKLLYSSQKYVKTVGLLLGDLDEPCLFCCNGLFINVWFCLHVVGVVKASIVITIYNYYRYNR